jgi:hypothetical protein
MFFPSELTACARTHCFQLLVLRDRKKLTRGYANVYRLTGRKVCGYGAKVSFFDAYYICMRVCMCACMCLMCIYAGDMHVYTHHSGFWAGPSGRVRPNLFDSGRQNQQMADAAETRGERETDKSVEALAGRIEADAMAVVADHGIPLMACGPRHAVLAPGPMRHKLRNARGMLSFGEGVHGELGLGHNERRSLPCECQRTSVISNTTFVSQFGFFTAFNNARMLTKEAQQ